MCYKALEMEIFTDDMSSEVCNKRGKGSFIGGKLLLAKAYAVFECLYE
jgi:hypothetical protein